MGEPEPLASLYVWRIVSGWLKGSPGLLDCLEGGELRRKSPLCREKGFGAIVHNYTLFIFDFVVIVFAILDDCNGR